MHGLHRLFIGDSVTISTRGGYVYVVADQASCAGSHQIMMTANQADEIARDLMAYAEQARIEKTPTRTA